MDSEDEFMSGVSSEEEIDDGASTDGSLGEGKSDAHFIFFLKPPLNWL